MSAFRRDPVLTAARASLALACASSVLFALPSHSWSQERGPLPKIAVLVADYPLEPDCTSRPPSATWSGFLEALGSFGYKNGQTVALYCRTARGDYRHLDALAAELVRMQPAVIVASAAPASLAAKRATSTIPIVSVYTADPVKLGLARSLARPGGNVTGLSALASDYVAMSLQLLKELAPQVSRVGVLGTKANPSFAIYRDNLLAAAKVLNLALDFESANAVRDIEPAIRRLQAQGANAFFVMNQPFTFTHRKDLVRAIEKHGLPAMYGSEEAVKVGGLISYAVSVPATFRRSAYFVDRILKGANPANLPIEQPTTFELAVNVKTAKALGITIPQSLLLRADRVVE